MMIVFLSNPLALSSFIICPTASSTPSPSKSIVSITSNGLGSGAKIGIGVGIAGGNSETCLARSSNEDPACGNEMVATASVEEVSGVQTLQDHFWGIYRM